MPPFLFGSGSGNVNMIGPVLGLAMILAMPEIVKDVKKRVGAGDGGYGAVLGGWALSGLKSGWKGDKEVGFIPGVSQIPGVAGRAALTTGGVAGGAYLGSRNGGGWKGVLTGGTIGGFVGANAPGITKGIVGTAKRQVYDVIGNEAANTVNDKVERVTTLIRESSEKMGINTSRTAKQSSENVQGNVIIESNESGRKSGRNRA